MMSFCTNCWCLLASEEQKCAKIEKSIYCIGEKSGGEKIGNGYQIIVR